MILDLRLLGMREGLEELLNDMIGEAYNSEVKIETITMTEKQQKLLQMPERIRNETNKRVMAEVFGRDYEPEEKPSVKLKTIPIYRSDYGNHNIIIKEIEAQ